MCPFLLLFPLLFYCRPFFLLLLCLCVFCVAAAAAPRVPYLQNAKRKSRIRRYFRKLDEPPLLPFARLSWRLLLLPSAAETRGRRKEEGGLLCVCTFFSSPVPRTPRPYRTLPQPCSIFLRGKVDN